MADSSNQLEIAVAELRTRVGTLERDDERAIARNTRNIDKQEQTIEGLQQQQNQMSHQYQAQAREVQQQISELKLDIAVSNAGMRGLDKLKWIIVTAIAAQIVTTFYSVMQPAAQLPSAGVRSK